MGVFSWCYCDNKSRIHKKNGIRNPSKKQRLMCGSGPFSKASLLFPKEFGGKDAQINITSYGGYGDFYGRNGKGEYAGGDVYVFVANWNREYMSKTPDFTNHTGKMIGNRSWYKYYSDLTKTPEEVCRQYAADLTELSGGNPVYQAKGLSVIYKRKEMVCGGMIDVTVNAFEYRLIGIFIADDDDDNVRLPYPIKIAKKQESVYEECGPSYWDPLQGCM